MKDTQEMIRASYQRKDLTSDDFKRRQVQRNQVLPHQLMRSSLLVSAEGFRAQVVFPAHCLLDLQALNRDGEQWRALTPEQKTAYQKQLKTETLPALPGLLGIPLLVDLEHLDGDWLFIESGDPEWLLRFNLAEYQQILALSETPQTACSVPLVRARPNFNEPHNDEHEIRCAVEHITQKRVRARLSESIEIAPLPLSLQQLLRLNSRDDVSSRELAGVIEMDPSLASQVISWANSPYYGAPGRVQSIEDAVLRVLGFDLTMNLALGLGMSRHLALPKDGVHGHRSFWRDALMHALLVERLVRTLPASLRPHQGTAYLAGLLYNFGYLVLAEVFPPHFSLYCRNQEANPHAPPMYVERFLFGITREQIASYLFTTWGLPQPLCVAIRQQFNPHYSGPHHVYANLLYLATAYRHPQQAEQLKRVPEAVFSRLGISREAGLEAWQALNEQSQDRIEDLIRLLETGR